MRDLFHNIYVLQALTPAVTTASQTSATIDLQGYNSAEIVFDIGHSGDTLSGSVYWTLTIQQSADNITYVPVATTDINNTNTTVVINSPGLDSTAYCFGYIGGMRYLQAVITATGTHTSGTPIGVIALRGTAAYSPVPVPD